MTWGHSPPWQVSRGSRVNHGSAGRSLMLLTHICMDTEIEMGQETGLCSKPQSPVPRNPLPSAKPSLSPLPHPLHEAPLSGDQVHKHMRPWMLFMFRPKHKSVFLFRNSLPCLCCYRKVTLSLNILSFRPLYLKKNILTFVYMSLKVNTITLSKGKLYNSTCMELTANTYRYNIDNARIHVYACKHIWTFVCMSFCGLAVVLWRKRPP